MSEHRSLAIVGGGITGLAAAYQALERGERSIDVYEGAPRFGGRILSGELDGVMVNRGAEFIDSDNDALLALCKAAGVSLVENKGMEAEFFQRLDGSRVTGDRFYAAYRPYAEQVMRDRAEIAANPQGARAQYVRSLTLDAYLQELRRSVAPASRSWWQALKDLVQFRSNFSVETPAIAGYAYASESGQLIGNISAAQFIAETSPSPEAFLASDCKYRVAGGTEQLVTQLRQQLEARGVRFHAGHALVSLAKTDGPEGVRLGFAGQPEVTAARTILAMPAYAFAQVKGLEQLGLPPEVTAALPEVQYTNSIKCTVAFKPGMAMPEAVYYAQGFQTWSPAPGQLTFLANADALSEGQNPKEFLYGLFEAYAKAHGGRAEAMFDTSKVMFSNPGKSACYATPRPAQVMALDALQAALPQLAERGIGIAGTYLPHQGGYGFMECGVVSANRACDLLLSRAQQQDLARAPVPELHADAATAPEATSSAWRDQVTQARANSASAGQATATAAAR